MVNGCGNPKSGQPRAKWRYFEATWAEGKPISAKAAIIRAGSPWASTIRVVRSTCTGAVPGTPAKAASTEALQWPQDMSGTDKQGHGASPFAQVYGALSDGAGQGAIWGRTGRAGLDHGGAGGTIAWGHDAKSLQISAGRHDLRLLCGAGPSGCWPRIDGRRQRRTLTLATETRGGAL